MGKIRIKTLGDEEQEKEQKKEAKKRQEAKKTEASKERSEDTTAENPSTEKKRADEEPAASERGGELIESKDSSESGRPAADDRRTPADRKTAQPEEQKEASEKPTKKPKEKFQNKKQSRSAKYQSVVSLVDRNKSYPLKEALEILPKLKVSKFDETVELHINTTETGVSGKLNLPHGTGKKMRVVIANPTKDSAGTDALIKEIESGKIEFDILLATPDAMPRLARVAKFLGPKGLMPNPKNGTVTKNPEEQAKQYEQGQINFKTEAKAPILHLTVGKLSFGDKKLAENITTVIKTIDAMKIRNITLKSTMSPGIKIQFASV